MKKEYIVRADFYPTGDIVPLGITEVGGETIYIQKVLEKKIVSPNQIELICFTKEGPYKLMFNKNKWTVNSK